MISNRITSIFPRVSRVISPAADASYRSTRLRFFPLSSRERLCPTFTRFRRAVSHLFSPDAAASSPWTRRGTKRSARPAPASVVRARAVLRIPRPAIFGNETAWPRALPAGTRKGEPASFFGGRSGPAALTRGEISWILWSLTNFEHRFSNESSIIRARLFFFWSKYEKMEYLVGGNSQCFELKIEIRNIFLYLFFRRLISRDAMLFSLRADKNLGLDARRFSLTMKGQRRRSLTALQVYRDDTVASTPIRR